MTENLSLPWSRGRHIAFTGIDGSGKTTQAGKLAYYVQQKFGPTYLAEPRTDLVSKLMHVLAFQHGKAGRREYFGHHVVDFSKAFDVVRDYYSTIAPLLAAGMHVVEPRGIPCRTAMALAMSGERDVKTEQVLAVIPKPDLLFWVNTDPSVAFSRVEERGIDVEKLEDLQRFREAFATMYPSSEWIQLDGDQAEDEVFDIVKRHVDTMFG